jgi:hypothetical protein
VSDDESDEEKPAHDEEGNRQRTRKWLKSLDLRFKYDDGHQRVGERHDATPQMVNDQEHLPPMNQATGIYGNEATMQRKVKENAI